MRANLAKSLLLGLLFAAIFVFAAVFLPFSEGYLHVLSGYAVPVLGYAFLVAYGLWTALILALAFAGSRYGGVRLAVFSLFAALGCMWAVPMAETIWLGEATGVMTRPDSLLRLAQGAVSLIVSVVLALLLYQTPNRQAKPAPPAVPAKMKLNFVGLAIWLLVLPVFHLILSFFARYFLVLRNPEALEFHTGETVLRPVLGELVHLLLNNALLFLLWLGQGFLLCVFLFLLALPLAEKRWLFLGTGVMMTLSPALLYLLPNPLMPDAVRMAHVFEHAAVGLVFGALSSFLLHRCIVVEKPAVPAEPAVKSAAAARPVAVRPAVTAAAKPAAK